MIRYALLCGKDHGFEAWFRDSDTFDVQNAAGQVACPVCGAPEVRKAVMAPSVRRSPKAQGPVAALPAEAPSAETAPSAPAPEPVIVDDRFAKLRAALREVHDKLKREAVDVGASFPEQARAIHEGDAPRRAIYGTATADEVRGLVEDGVGILPIPVLPDDRN